MRRQIDLKQAARRPCLLLMVVVIAAVFLLEGWMIWALEQSGVGLPAMLAMHILASLLLLSMAPICQRHGRDVRLLLLGFLMVLFLGPVGAGGMLLATFAYAVYRRRATPFEIWYREILPEQITPPEERLIERLRAWAEETEIQHHEPVPFADILASGSRAEKQTAIALMARNFHLAFAPAFRESLNDPDNAVRVQTASAITRIEEEFLARALVLEREHERHPDDPEVLWQLARHYDKHASAGLSDPDTVLEYRERAETAYRRLSELRNDDAVLWALGRLLVRAGRTAEAASVFEQALKVSNDQAHPLQRVWYWECLYDQKRFHELRAEVRGHYNQIPRDATLPPSLLDSIDLWAIGGFQTEATAS